MIPQFQKTIRFALVHIFILIIIGILLISFNTTLLIVILLISIVSFISYTTLLLRLLQKAKKNEYNKLNFTYLISIFLFSISYLVVTSVLFNYGFISDDIIIIGITPILPFIVSLIVYFVKK